MIGVTQVHVHITILHNYQNEVTLIRDGIERPGYIECQSSCISSPSVKV